MLMSELFAISQSAVCEGSVECHWCSAPCTRDNLHNDPPPMIGIRREATKRPASPYICNGCRIYRYPFITSSYISSGYKDRQTWSNQSWYCTKTGIWGIRLTSAEDRAKLYALLLTPPKSFGLSFITDKNKNLLQLAVANSPPEIRADTPLKFTVNNIIAEYTIYELEQAIKNDNPTGTLFGVRSLIELLGPCPRSLVPVEEKQKKTQGRQHLEDGKITKKPIFAGR